MHHRRMHPDRHPWRDADLEGIDLGDGQELDDVAELAGHGDVGRRDAGDAFVVHVAGDDGGAEGQGGDDGGFGAGVEPLDISGWIPLGVSELLGVGQGLGERGAFVAHLGQDVVGGAVDDAHHPADGLTDQRFAQDPDERDAARHRGLEEQVPPGLGGCLEQLGSVVGEELLVAGDDRLTVGQRGQDQFAGGLDAADHLDDDVDVGIVDDRAGVGGERLGGHLGLTFA